MPGPDASAPLAVDRRLGGRYRLVGPIARGGMAEVWQAYDEVLSRPVAVKVLLSHLATDVVVRERFRREAVTAARLAHPNVVATYDTGIDGGVAYIVMELVQGQTLRHLLATHGALAVPVAVSITDQIADALAHAHRAGLIHRDVKPANVLLADEDGPLPRIKVTDFGIAKAIEGVGVDLTSTGMVLGTPKYLSPEQVDGREPDARADLYSLGVVLFEMLTGRPPFSGPTEMATALSHLRDPAPVPSSLHAGIPPALDAIVARLLAKDPAARFASADDLRLALTAAAPGFWLFDPTTGLRVGTASAQEPTLLQAAVDHGARTPGAARPMIAPGAVGAGGAGEAGGVAGEAGGVAGEAGGVAGEAGGVAGAAGAAAGAGRGVAGSANGAVPGRVGPKSDLGVDGTRRVVPHDPSGRTASVPGAAAGPAITGRGPLAPSPSGMASAIAGPVGTSPTPRAATTPSPAARPPSRRSPDPPTDLWPHAVPAPSDRTLPPTGEPEPRRPGRRPRPRRSHRPSAPGLVVAALVVAGAVVGAVLLTRPTGTGATGPSTRTALPLVDAGVFVVSARPPDDPAGARNVIDGNPATVWQTDVYGSAHFGNLYPGIGLYVRLASPHTLHNLAAIAPTSGWSASTYVSAVLPTDRSGVGGWGAPTDSQTATGTTTSFSLGGRTGTWVLLWLTSTGGPPFRTVIGDITVS